MPFHHSSPKLSGYHLCHHHHRCVCVCVCVDWRQEGHPAIKQTLYYVPGICKSTSTCLEMEKILKSTSICFQHTFLILSLPHYYNYLWKSTTKYLLHQYKQLRYKFAEWDLHDLALACFCDYFGHSHWITYTLKNLTHRERRLQRHTVQSSTL